MESIRDKVAVVGMGCTPYGDHYDKTAEDLLIEACDEALEDAGIDSHDIQAAWLGGDGTSHTLGHALKLDFVPISQVDNWCATGSDTLRNAVYAVAAGAYDVVLVAGVAAAADVQPPNFTPSFNDAAGDPWPMVIPGMAAGPFSTFATRYAHHYELSFDQLKQALGSIAIKNYDHGRLNPKAALHKTVTMEQYLQAPIISWPFGLHDCCVMPNGAAAAVITRAQIAPSFRDDFVLIKGVGMAVGNRGGRMDSDYDWVHMEENVIAAERAYTDAGISDPVRDLDLAEVHDAFSVVELAVYEDLGWAPRGAGGDLSQDGVFRLGGELPVNTNGGLKSFGHGVGSCGIHKLYELYKQLQGKCGDRQVPNASLGLTHDQGGLPGIFTTVITVAGTRD